MEEVWKPVVGYENEYIISNLGRLKSLPRQGTCKQEKIRKTYLDKKGYEICTLVKNKKYKYEKIHRLVAKAFIHNPENKPQVNHKNGIKNDNRVENLEWCTNGENQLHAIKIGLRKNENISKSKKKKIIQYDLKGNFIKIWDSAKDAKKFYNTSAHIEAVCKGKRNKALNCIWRYMKTEEKDLDINEEIQSI